MDEQKLKTRLRQAAIIARLMLLVSRLLHNAYNRGAHLAAVYPELLVMMVIIINDDRRHPPVTTGMIVNKIGLSERSTRRYVGRLITHGLVLRKDGGYTTNPAFFAERIDAPYFRRIRTVVVTAAKQFRNF